MPIHILIWCQGKITQDWRKGKDMVTSQFKGEDSEYNCIQLNWGKGFFSAFGKQSSLVSLESLHMSLTCQWPHESTLWGRRTLVIGPFCHLISVCHLSIGGDNAGTNSLVESDVSWCHLWGLLLIGWSQSSHHCASIGQEDPWTTW